MPGAFSTGLHKSSKSDRRQLGAAKLTAAMSIPADAAIAIAILIGDRSALSDADERRLQEAGTYHVIAISGGNIAILAAILLTLMRLMRVPASASAGLTIAALLFYGEIASGGASVSPTPAIRR